MRPQLYVGLLPEGVTPAELKGIMTLAARRSLWHSLLFNFKFKDDFRRHARVEIQQRRYRDRIVRFAIVDLPDDAMARFFMAAMMGTAVRHQPVLTRPYIHRAYANDRRDPRRAGAYGGPNRRTRDRRKSVPLRVGNRPQPESGRGGGLRII